MTITPEFIEKLRDRISLSSIIGKRVKLQKEEIDLLVCVLSIVRTVSYTHLTLPTTPYV